MSIEQDIQALFKKTETLEQGLEWLIERGKGGKYSMADDDYSEGLESDEFWELVESEYMSGNLAKAAQTMSGWWSEGPPSVLKEGFDPEKHNCMFVSVGDCPEVFNVWGAFMPQTGSKLNCRDQENGKGENFYGSYHRGDEIETKPFDILVEECPTEGGMFFWQVMVALAVREGSKSLDTGFIPVGKKILLMIGPNESPYIPVGSLSRDGWQRENFTVVYE